MLGLDSAGSAARLAQSLVAAPFLDLNMFQLRLDTVYGNACDTLGGDNTQKKSPSLNYK